MSASFQLSVFKLLLSVYLTDNTILGKELFMKTRFFSDW